MMTSVVSGLMMMSGLVATTRSDRYDDTFPRSFEIMDDATPQQLALRRAWMALKVAA